MDGPLLRFTVSLLFPSANRKNIQVTRIGTGSGITLRKCAKTDFLLLHTAPLLSNGWAVLGELDKWIPVAAARLARIEELVCIVLVSLFAHECLNSIYVCFIVFIV